MRRFLKIYLWAALCVALPFCAYATDETEAEAPATSVAQSVENEEAGLFDEAPSTAAPIAAGSLGAPINPAPGVIRKIAQPEAPAHDRQMVNGFYPIWENTGYTHPSLQLFLGTSDTQFGITDNMLLGIRPMLFVHRTPNLHYKAKIFNWDDAFALSLKVELLWLFKNADTQLFSAYYASRLHNPDSSIALIPISVSGTWSPIKWLHLHNTFTLLPLFAGKGNIKNGASLGYSIVAQFIASVSHSFTMHFGEVGFWDHDFNYLGASYCYNGELFFAQLGYFYRIRQEGNQGSPLIALGVYF